MTTVHEFCLHELYMQEFCLHDHSAQVFCMTSVGEFCLHDLSRIVTRHLYLESRRSHPP
jgi:hypothetical protein